MVVMDVAVIVADSGTMYRSRLVLPPHKGSTVQRTSTIFRSMNSIHEPRQEYKGRSLYPLVAINSNLSG